ncbi:hypothetical protein AAY473_037850 [Plecturocebus cupreus]
MRPQVPAAALSKCEARDRASSVGAVVTRLGDSTWWTDDPTPATSNGPTASVAACPADAPVAPPASQPRPCATADLAPGDPGVLQDSLSCPQTLILIKDLEALPSGPPSSATNDDLLLLSSSLPLVAKHLPRCQLWKERCSWEVMTLSTQVLNSED